MAKIHNNLFSGVAPAVPVRYLQNNQAQTATNCIPWKGPLTPLNDVGSALLSLEKVGVQAIYRFGQDVDSDTQYWFTFTNAVDVVKGAIADDTAELTFYTGDGGVPKATDSTLALTGGGSNYPIASYELGVPVPTDALTCVVSGTAEEGAVTSTRVYTYVYVNSWGWPSAPYSADPYPASTTVDVATGQDVTITIPSPPTGNFNLDYVWIYCSAEGSDTDSLLFVAQVDIATSEYVHAFDADELAEECLSVDWLPPDDDLEGLIGTPGGVTAGFVGKDVYLSVPYRPYAYPIAYRQTVDYKIIGLGSIDTTIVVLTQGRPSLLQGGHPDSMQMVDVDLDQACVSKRSIVSAHGAVLYASPDGLCVVSASGSRVITGANDGQSALFEKEQWQEISPESIHAYLYDNKYIAFYDTGSVQGGFIYDPATRSFAFHNIYCDAGYSDLKNDTLYLSIDDELVKWDAGAALDVVWKSKKHTFPFVMTFAFFRVKAEAYPVTIKLYRDGALIHTKSVTDDSIYTLPDGAGQDWEYQIEGDEIVHEVVIAQTVDEIVNEQ